MKYPANMPMKDRPCRTVQMGIPGNMVRFSVGIEEVENSIADFYNALKNYR